MEPKEKEKNETPKKPYEPPELMIFGDVEDITKFLQAGPSDGDGGLSTPIL